LYISAYDNNFGHLLNEVVREDLIELGIEIEKTALFVGKLG